MFCKDPDTVLQSAILGFEDEENLFFSNGSWQPQYVPLMLQKGPFLIGESSPIILIMTKTNDLY